MAIKQLDKLGQKIFEQRYAYPGETKWSDRAKVIARQIASAEKDTDAEKWTAKFYDSISSGDLVPGGRIIFGAGRMSGQYNLLNCYAIEPEDSVESIGKTIQDTYKISCAGGGIGFNFSKIRPKGDDIQNIKNSAPGAVSVMRMVNEIGDHVRAGKNRRTALMAQLNVTHPDILEFLYVKLDQGELNNFNISVAITDRFIEACDNDEPWYFNFKNRKYYVYSLKRTTPAFDGTEDISCTINIVAMDEEDALARANNHYLNTAQDQFSEIRLYPLSARELWSKLWKSAVESGDPGIYNISLANKYTNVSYFEELNQTNPCGEIPLPSYANCCLGHVNLSNMVLDGEVDWKRLAKTVRAGIRFLDNVLTVNLFPTPECREAGHRSRRIGLGILGYHHMLIQLGIVYGSEKCLEFTERLMETIRNEAYLTSIYLSREKGPFPAFNAKKYLKEDFARTLSPRIRMLIKEHGIRNAVMLTIAPTGTISMVMGVSSGIEPIFSAIYKRRYRKANAWEETIVLDPLFKEYLKRGEPLEAFVGAYDVKPEDHIKLQAVVQRYIDSAISKTINLPSDAVPEDFEKSAMDYASDMKGITVYRASSKSNEPLEAIPLTAANIKRYTLADSETGTDNGAVCTLNGDCG